jgi:glycosyltransferase involved in cell wall biosynthesis
VEVLKRADAVLVATSAEEREAISMGGNPEKIHVVPIAVDPKKWEKANGDRFREKYGLKNQSIVLFAGSKCYEKGAVTLLRALNVIQRKRKNVILVASGIDFPEWLEEKREMLNLKMIDLGYIPEREKYDMFAACDIYAMPSRVDSFGITYLEAWICGKPVIGARVGAIPEVIYEGKDGFLVEFDNVEELAQKILILLANPSQREELGASGRVKVLDNHTLPFIVDKIEDIYKSCST